MLYINYIALAIVTSWDEQLSIPFLSALGWIEVKASPRCMPCSKLLYCPALWLVATHNAHRPAAKVHASK